MIIVSAQQMDYQSPPALLLFQLQAPSRRPKEALSLAVGYSKSLKPIEVVRLRHDLPSSLGSLLSNHLIEIHKVYTTPQKTLVETAAKSHADLVAWGEPSAAKVLAEAEGISIRTMHSRLMNARKKGLLDSPGTGFRFNSKPFKK